MGMVFGSIGVEMPAYDAVSSTEVYEVRRYGAGIMAQVSSASWPADAAGTSKAKFTNEAFRVLARYIGVFGKPENVAVAPIAMTAPVVSQSQSQSAATANSGSPEQVAMTAPVVSGGGGAGAGAAAETMGFILPASYTLETAPTPTDSRVALVAIAGRDEAVSTFTWTCDMTAAEQRAAELIATLKQDGVEIDGPWTLARYNPPWTLPWLRRNEIHVPVKARL